MDTQTAHTFAATWVRDWNAHDLEALLAHFTQDVVFTSPVAAQIMPETGGVLRGKPALRAYWARGLELIPDLRFEVLGVFTGIDTVVIQYRNHAGTVVCEVLTFTGDRVSSGHGTYPSPDAAGASGVTAQASAGASVTGRTH